ncbi:MAG: 4-(cytidine 5'-diphospho)-2-C-methyl-D-erythritol kinase [Candidatus Eremiobacteraeota bacterium]|nr:4-(cytidine 5'-diphospho)-2-C-methyl-D-erythritol kinase [Candidatus Eremiobacteraeota bacterium]
MQPSVVLRAPAKLNLTLEVGNRRADGYHTVRSLMVPIDLCDEISVQAARAFSFSCSREDLNAENLVERAFEQAAPHLAVDVRLTKVIPTGAGLGGGSSDAAAIVRAAAGGVLQVPRPADPVAIARALGSDVPFFLAGTAAVVEGTGERVTPLGAMPRWWTVIVKPPASVSTADAYRRLDERERPSRARNASLTIDAGEALQRGDFPRVVELLWNDFESVVYEMAPQIAQARTALIDAGATHALLTGSGACVFALAPDEAEARALDARVQLPGGYARFVVPFLTSRDWRA